MKLVALLRGVNLGGSTTMLKNDLVAAFETAGCTGIKTYLQSGNVVFHPPADGLVEASLGLKTTVVLRTHAEMKAALAGNPYFNDGDNESRHFVMFLKHTPEADRVATLDPDRSPGDRFTVAGSEIYLDVAHAAKSKLTNAYFDSRLKTVSTTRNMRTVRKLTEMSEE